MFYESPHRIEKALASLAEVLGEERTVTVARELTKLHESLVQGSRARSRRISRRTRRRCAGNSSSSSQSSPRILPAEARKGTLGK